MNILGLHCSFTAMSHDPSVCLIQDGRVVFALEEERLNRIKTSSGFFPERAMHSALQFSGLDIGEIDLLVVDGELYPSMALKIERYIRDIYGICPPISIVNHALSHAYGAYYCSGIKEDALVVSVDGVGDGISTYVGLFRSDGRVEEIYRAGAEVSLGLFYGMFTNFLGFKRIEGEYKLMGMAAYGEPVYDLSSLLRFDSSVGALVASANPVLAQHYTSIWEPSYDESVIASVFSGERPLKRKFSKEHFDLAASVQRQFESAYIGLITHFLGTSNAKNLCLSGGCALNCLANKQLLRLGLGDIYVMPGASDRGLAIGSAIMGALQFNDSIQSPSSMYLGLEYSDEEILKAVEHSGLKCVLRDNYTEVAARSLLEGKVIGWFSGRSEFGPRALGHRSILALPSIRGMKDKLNAKIKFREPFRPFAPAVLIEDLKGFSNYGDREFPYMTFTLDVNKEELREAIHRDGTARVQSVSKADCPAFYDLLAQVRHLTGFGGVLNTSFNLAGEPIVESPADAIRTFTSSGIDELFLGKFQLLKKGH